jgi:hypothetical protein
MNRSDLVGQPLVGPLRCRLRVLFLLLGQRFCSFVFIRPSHFRLIIRSHITVRLRWRCNNRHFTQSFFMNNQESYYDGVVIGHFRFRNKKPSSIFPLLALIFRYLAAMIDDNSKLLTINEYLCQLASRTTYLVLIVQVTYSSLRVLANNSNKELQLPNTSTTKGSLSEASEAKTKARPRPNDYDCVTTSSVVVVFLFSISPFLLIHHLSSDYIYNNIVLHLQYLHVHTCSHRSCESTVLRVKVQGQG